MLTETANIVTAADPKAGQAEADQGAKADQGVARRDTLPLA